MKMTQTTEGLDISNKAPVSKAPEKVVLGGQVSRGFTMQMPGRSLRTTLEG